LVLPIDGFVMAMAPVTGFIVTELVVNITKRAIR